MWNFIKNLFISNKTPELFLGVLNTPEDMNNTANVHQFAEGVAMANTPVFPVKKTSELRKFPYQYQDGSFACFAYSMAKISCVLYYLLTGRKIKFSPAYFYAQRINKPGGGMIFSDVSIIASIGSCLYDLLPCEGMTEVQMNAIKVEQYQKDSADAFAIPANWIDLPDFDTVASTIETTGKPVIMLFSFGPGEWFNTQYPRVLGTNKPWAHAVVGVDTFTDTASGKQYIKIEDSADKEGYYEKYIDRAFFERCWFKRNPINFKFVKIGITPVYAGTIASMQDILKSLGYFPVNQQSTGIWGSITDGALIKFCQEYGLVFVQGRKMWPELDKKLYSFN